MRSTDLKVLNVCLSEIDSILIKQVINTHLEFLVVGDVEGWVRIINSEKTVVCYSRSRNTTWLVSRHILIGVPSLFLFFVSLPLLTFFFVSVILVHTIRRGPTVQLSTETQQLKARYFCFLTDFFEILRTSEYEEPTFVSYRLL